MPCDGAFTNVRPAAAAPDTVYDDDEGNVDDGVAVDIDDDDGGGVHMFGSLIPSISVVAPVAATRGAAGRPIVLARSVVALLPPIGRHHIHRIWYGMVYGKYGVTKIGWTCK